MKETFHSYLGNLVGNTKDLLTSLSTEKTAASKETSQGFPKSSAATAQEKADHPTSQPAEKRKKSRIPFVALALVVVFTSLYALSLLGLQPSVRATGAYLSSAHHDHSASLPLDATSEANCIEANCTGNSPDNHSPSSGVLPSAYLLGTTCKEHFKNAAPTIGSATLQSFCATPDDFLWGNLDVTCVYDDNLDTQLRNLNKDNNLQFGPNSVNPNASPNQNQTPDATPYTPSGSFYNQNTCVPGHHCYSDNASGQDKETLQSDGTTLEDAADAQNNINTSKGDKITTNGNGHTQLQGVVEAGYLTGGDDVVCSNDACTGRTSADDTTGTVNICGSGMAYEKLACAQIDKFWYYNPTAYAPNGAVEELYTKKVADNQPSTWISQNEDRKLPLGNSDPSCQGADTGIGHWTCGSGDRILLLMQEGSNTYGTTFYHDPNQTDVGSDVQEVRPVMNTKDSSAGLGSSVSWYYPPTWEVKCTNNGSDSGQFPCSDVGGKPDPTSIKGDWLSGDPGVQGTTGSPGHIAIIYNQDTIDSPYMAKLFGITLAIGYASFVPVLILIGYQLLWASWTLRRADAIEAFAKLTLSIMAVSICFELTRTLLGLSNLLSDGMLHLHQQLGYPPGAKVGGTLIPYTLEGDDDTTSFRGIVIPISRWGCIANDFVALLIAKFFTDALKYVPYFGGLASLALGIVDAVEFAKRIGEFALLLFSINLFVQIIVRTLLINYYILTSPIAFACWGLQGGAGQKIVGQWFKGFVSLLAIPVLQLFILTTLPLIMPALPNLPTDKTFGIINTFIGQLPPLVVLMATVRVPKMLGTGATKAIAQAGTMASGGVAALAGAAYQAV